MVYLGLHKQWFNHQFINSSGIFVAWEKILPSLLVVLDWFVSPFFLSELTLSNMELGFRVLLVPLTILPGQP